MFCVNEVYTKRSAKDRALGNIKFGLLKKIQPSLK